MPSPTAAVLHGGADAGAGAQHTGKKDMEEAEGEPSCILEGLLETRGPGRIGRWTPGWFRLEADMLLELEPKTSLAGQQGLRRSIPLASISELSHDRKLGEIIVCSHSSKLRFRSAPEQAALEEEEIWTWFSALRVLVERGQDPLGEFQASEAGSGNLQADARVTEPGELPGGSHVDTSNWRHVRSAFWLGRVRSPRKAVVIRGALDLPKSECLQSTLDRCSKLHSLHEAKQKKT